MKKDNIKTYVVIGWLLISLTGCVTSMDRVNREVGEHQPISYREGYQHGCNSGYVAAGHPYYRFEKDMDRHLNNELYRSGWNDGFLVCKGKYESIQRSLY